MDNNLIYNDDTFDFLPLLDDKSIDIIITDPPYDFDREQISWLHNHFERIARKAVIVFSPPENQWFIPIVGMLPDSMLFWIKPISTKNTSKNYSRFVEMVFVYKMEDYTWNTERNWANYVNVFNDFVEGKSGHPFEKPRSLIRRLILNHSNEGDIILDPFAGSGIIPIEAKKLNRKYIANEIDEEWFLYMEKKLNE